MYQPQSVYTKVAWAAILRELTGEKSNNDFPKDFPNETLSDKRGCFVSLHKTDGSLRGCIGTIEPTESDLKQEIIRNAISACFHDTRFDPVVPGEIDDIEISVDVLTEPEEIFSFDDLDPLIYGVIVCDKSGRRAVLLPSIPSIDTVERQIEIVKRKAGLGHINDNKLKFYRFTSNRYH
jgi:AmmeMemoRadiSam system protein A